MRKTVPGTDLTKCVDWFIDTSVFASDQWNIKFKSQEKNIKLREKYIQQLLKIGKNIASNHPDRGFKIVLEYEGNLNES